MSRSASTLTSPCNIIGVYTPKTRALPFDAVAGTFRVDLEWRGPCRFCVHTTPCVRAGKCLSEEAV